MKKTFYLLLSICILFIAGCSTTPNKEAINHIKTNEIANTSNSNILSLPLEITKVNIDMNGDGKNEKISIVLFDGEETAENNYKGQFALCLYDKNENQLDKLDIKLDKTIADLDYTFPKDFTIIFKDYNGDGILDFNIGNPDIGDNKNYIYNFYTLSNENKLKELKINDEEDFITSCEKGYSYEFKISGNKFFNTYKSNGLDYTYKTYGWEKDCFIVFNHFYSSVDYKYIDKSLIKEKLSQIISSVEIITEKNILDACEEQYNWCLNNPEDLYVYFFMNNNYEEPQYEIERLLSNRIFELKQINEQFNIFKIDDIRKYSLEDVKQFESPFGKIDYKEYDWKVKDKNYKLLAGGFHLDNFVLLFDESGQYLDGYIWTDKIRNKVQVSFRNKQNFISISPIRENNGTGISTFGCEWFEVYKDKLLSRFEYPVYGYEAPPYTIGYSIKYELIDDNYNKATGDYEAAYKLGIAFVGDEFIGIEKTVHFYWNEDNNYFEPVNSDIYDCLYNRLFCDGIEDEILKKNCSKLEAIIKDDDTNKYKEDNMEVLTVFLTKCSQNEKKDTLLKELYDYYTIHSDIWNSKELIDMIKKAMNINNSIF